MGDQCHAGGYLGILAQSAGNDYGVQSQRHSKGAEGADGKVFWQGKHQHRTKKKQRKDKKVLTEGKHGAILSVIENCESIEVRCASVFLAIGIGFPAGKKGQTAEVFF